MPRFPDRHRFPLQPEHLADLEKAVRIYVLPGCCPETPIISRSAIALTAGSCFAEEIANALTQQQVQAAWLQTESDTNMSPMATAALLKRDTNPVLKSTLAQAGLVVLTIGQAMTAFVDGVAAVEISREISDMEWRLLTPEETAGAIRSMIGTIRAHNPNCHIVLTLSPIPLKVSIGHPSPFFQDCLSKSILRVGIDLAMASSAANISYWPSFEIVRWLGGHIGPFFGGIDNRHPTKAIVDLITRLFIEKYFLPA